MPRKRIYENDAARVAAFEQRKKFRMGTLETLLDELEASMDRGGSGKAFKGIDGTPEERALAFVEVLKRSRIVVASKDAPRKKKVKGSLKKVGPSELPAEGES